jgi:CRISPR-associated protein Cas2
MSGPRKKRVSQQSADVLCGYRLMWVLVMFDLPVLTKAERKAASGFRFDLLDLGFERCQYSVYLRFVEGYAQAESLSKKVQRQLPSGGKVYLLYFTDKQYASIIRFENSKRCSALRNPGQFELF